MRGAHIWIFGPSGVRALPLGVAAERSVLYLGLSTFLGYLHFLYFFECLVCFQYLFSDFRCSSI